MSWRVCWGSKTEWSSGRRSGCWIAESVAWRKGGCRSRTSCTGRMCTTRLLGAYAVTPGSRLRLLLAHSLVAAGQYQRGLDALADWRSDDASSTDLALAALLRAEALQRARLGGDEAIIAASKQAITLGERANAASFLARAH